MKLKEVLTTTVKEHKAACRLAAFERSAVVEQRSVEWDDAEILDTATDPQESEILYTSD